MLLLAFLAIIGFTLLFTALEADGMEFLMVIPIILGALFFAA